MITSDGQLVLGQKHTSLANNANVRAAGQMMLSGKGDIHLIDNLSGHFRPTVAEGLRVPELLNDLGLKTNGAYLKLYDLTLDSDCFVTNSTLTINWQLK
ncbi:hypothetical protein QWZ03_03725 [Chitinimonas viridis]|uniref:Uncharacterized protein n=1 Tax=Chitinimonas viridis TaxID=664880 RepID=A0ABT8B1J7_9NEIS|nr:hypothetical protein [Chitinimonas viridis]MDN3575880.1 hypothetical protein [Chitinimonas viridis]